MSLIKSGLRARKLQFAFLTRWVALDWRMILAFCLPFALYLLTAAPTIYNLDSAELTTAAATSGIARATGYPLYLMLGYLWSWLPLGDVGYRMNLLSAFNGALTIALAERVLRRLAVGPWATFGALGLLACANSFWSLSLVAEVYTFQTTLMAALLLVLLRWNEHPSPQRLALVGLMLGLALSHHGATLLLLPGCAFFLLTRSPRQMLAPRALMFACGGLLLGLSCYLYLPLRYVAHPLFNYAGHYNALGQFISVDLRTPQGVFWLVSGQAFRNDMLAYDRFELWSEVERFGILIWRTFLGIGITPGIVGLIVLLRRNWRLGGALLLMWLCHVAFYVDYRVFDKETMFLPAYLIWALWLGVGYQTLLNWVREPANESSWLRLLPLQGLILGAALFAMLWNWPLVDSSRDWSTRTRSENILRHSEHGALIVGWWDVVPSISYLQLVEGQRPDMETLNRFLIAPDDLQRLLLREIQRRPVYIDSVPGGLQPLVETRTVGPLLQLFPKQKNGPR